jgi:hypothetical protein
MSITYHFSFNSNQVYSAKPLPNPCNDAYVKAWNQPATNAYDIRESVKVSLIDLPAGKLFTRVNQALKHASLEETGKIGLAVVYRAMVYSGMPKDIERLFKDAPLGVMLQELTRFRNSDDPVLRDIAISAQWVINHFISSGKEMIGDPRCGGAVTRRI